MAQINFIRSVSVLCNPLVSLLSNRCTYRTDSWSLRIRNRGTRNRDIGVHLFKEVKYVDRCSICSESEQFGWDPLHRNASRLAHIEILSVPINQKMSKFMRMILNLLDFWSSEHCFRCSLFVQKRLRCSKCLYWYTESMYVWPSSARFDVTDCSSGYAKVFSDIVDTSTFF